MNIAAFLPVRSERTLLKRIQSDDCAELYDVESCPETKRYLDGPVKKERAQWIEQMVSACEKSEIAIIRHAERNELIGRAALAGEHWRPELEIVLGRRWWGDGYGVEVAKEILALATMLKVHSVYAVVHPENHASIRMLESLAFRPMRVSSPSGKLHSREFCKSL